MKVFLRYWWTGMMLITVGSLLRGFFALIDMLEPSLVGGQRPLWWRITGVALSFIALGIAPLIVRHFARQIVRTEGLLGPVEPSTEITPTA
jgi:hypothetical protein